MHLKNNRAPPCGGAILRPKPIDLVYTETSLAKPSGIRPFVCHNRRHWTIPYNRRRRIRLLMSAIPKQEYAIRENGGIPTGETAAKRTSRLIDFDHFTQDVS